MESLINLWQATGFYQMTIGQFFMISIGCLLLFLAIHPKFQFEPLLLLPMLHPMSLVTAMDSKVLLVSSGGVPANIYHP